VVLPKDNELQASRRDLPVEFGAINLMPSDPIEGASKGLIAAMVIEPQGSVWAPDGELGTDGKLTRAAVTISEPSNRPGDCTQGETGTTCQTNSECDKPAEKGVCVGGKDNGNLCSGDNQCRRGTCQGAEPFVPGYCELPAPTKLFRDFVVVHQDNVNMLFGGAPLPTVSHEEEPEDSGMKGLNYRTDPIWHRLKGIPTADAATTRAWDYTNAFAGEPQTPVYTASPGEKIRLRVLKPGGHNRNHVVTLHGFLWPRYPFSNDDGIADTDDDSARIWPDNPYTFWHGEQMGHGPTNHINVVPLGGCPATGDFLYRDMVPVHVDNGQWAIVRCQ